MQYEESRLDIPPSWEQIDYPGLRGTLLVVGAPDVGKTTFAQFLYRRLHAVLGSSIAYLDGDPGQSSLGPPTTMTLAFNLTGHASLWRYFVGALSPRGHMLPTLVGAARLIRLAGEEGARAVVYDTSGLIAPDQGGLALKSAKIDLLQPPVVFAIQREEELEPLLVPLRRSGRSRVVSLRPSPAVRRRDTPERRSHRTNQFADYFAGAHTLLVDWRKLAVFPFPRFSLHRLVALENRDGFTLALGIVVNIERNQRQVKLKTPLPSLDRVNAIRLGDVLIDPHTYQDVKLGE